MIESPSLVIQCDLHVSSIYCPLEGIVHGHTPEERLRLLAERLLVAMEMGYPTYFTGLEEVSSCIVHHLLLHGTLASSLATCPMHVQFSSAGAAFTTVQGYFWGTAL